MGCKFSKNDKNSSISNMPNSNEEYKARLERKICLAKETPEPIYDISECNLKEIPNGTYIMCKILRKEVLILADNRLTSLNGGGLLIELQNLTILNLCKNKFKKLPDEISQLENLRELYISQNILESLPNTFNRLKNLEILDLSSNNIIDIKPISYMERLQLLNVSSNIKLKILPNEISTCDSLVEIVLDQDNIIQPPSDVIKGGTSCIIKFLSTGIDRTDPHQTEKKPIATDINTKFISNEKNEKFLHALEKGKIQKEKMLLEERKAAAKDYNLGNKFQEDQLRKKEEFLQKLIQQQNQNESNFQKLHEDKLAEKQKLITEILDEEKNSAQLVNKLLTLKNGQDPALLEREQQEQEELLEKLRLKDKDLRKQEILTAMTSLLKNEIDTIQKFHSQRDQSSKDILAKEDETQNLLNGVFLNYDQNRQEIINKVNTDEEIQRSVVAALLEKNDSRSWGLVEQIKIVESQLKSLTVYEINRKKMSVDERMNDLAEQRINLTVVLMELMEQQDKRKQQLLETIQIIEKQKEKEEENFWLLQYQKLMDTQSPEMKLDTAIDPELGYNFLINGVVHCIPFLSKLWKTKENNLESISDSDLIEAGIQKENDRIGILKAIKAYVEIFNENVTPSAPLDEYLPSAPPLSEESSTASQTRNHNFIKGLAECVVCMEEAVEVIFLPCGHMCCCSNCQTSIFQCPLCRSCIDRRVKVVQP